MVAEAEPTELDRVRKIGGLSPSAIERIAAEISIEEIITGIKEMLSAMLRNDQPDWRAREIAIKLWLSYVIGLPVQRQHIIQEKISTPSPDKLLENPVAVETLFRLALATEAGKAALAKVAAEGAHDT